MATEREMEELLRKLVEATHEAKTATTEAHVVHRDLRKLVKDSLRDVKEMITAEVTRQVGELESAAVVQMRDGADEMLLRIDADWRKKLGLD